MLIDVLLIILGLALLIKGGDWMVDGASNLARRYKISELAIGLTIVAFGTSAPELVVSSVASVDGHPEIVFGNVIGSNNFNLFIILGITGCIAPLMVPDSTIRKEIPISLLAAVVMFLLANYGFLSGDGNMLNRIDGIILLVFFSVFVYYVFRSMKTDGNNDEKTAKTVFPLGKSLLFIVLGMACLIAGGKLAVNSAVDLARILHVSEKVIGLTVVAVGTSLPELVTSVTAIRKKNSNIAIGNVIGSNIFNIFLILGVGALWRPLAYSPVFNTDIYLLIFGTLFLLLSMFTGRKKILDRWEAAIFVAVYVGYVVYLIMRPE